ncbi:SdpI family protein [Saccharibacillus sp. CPCC 101409]|uniref:SdpI family protein n=1 Tax=Saccharibacillus sp. CPCC 101409 TaxID=3058041 RepID=UPI00267274A4|nr:SdpI family protein [Saccharibacillus sp. CPCC 101409]MDO3409411.1 SdpI family protein [Saccharibacillus sp. CPCC 101409]
MSVWNKRLSWILIAVIAIVSIAVYPGLPEQLVIRISDSGVPLNTAPKWIGAWAIPLVMLLLHATRPYALRGVPGNSVRDAGLISMIVQFVLAGAQIALLLYAYNRGFLLRDLIVPALGLLLIFIGNVLFRARPNFSFGLLNKWALADSQAWKSSQRFGGCSFISAGLLVVAASFRPQSALFYTALIVGLVMINYAASFFFYRKYTSAGGR